MSWKVPCSLNSASRISNCSTSQSSHCSSSDRTLSTILLSWSASARSIFVHRSIDWSTVCPNAGSRIGCAITLSFVKSSNMPLLSAMAVDAIRLSTISSRLLFTSILTSDPTSSEPIRRSCSSFTGIFSLIGLPSTLVMTSPFLSFFELYAGPPSTMLSILVPSSIIPTVVLVLNPVAVFAVSTRRMSARMAWMRRFVSFRTYSSSPLYV
mmetsp:Transcript_50544/g.100899  ORF Transcript_50544/g.100899 Transcript_50544/m.100899 type:complete len:210 (-) Transcript_50544:959-1588(-)